MNNNYRIFNRDSLEFIKKMRDNSVDFIFTDPPYNISNLLFAPPPKRFLPNNP